MKNVLITGAVGVGLLGATIGGLLVTQGRWNYEGTKNIPLLNVLFTAPAEDGADPVKIAAGRTPAPPDVGAGEFAPGELSPAPMSESVAAKDPATVREFAPGSLLRLGQIESAGVTVEEVNQIIEDSRKLQASLAAQREKLEKHEEDLELRERDLRDRQQEIESMLAAVVAKRTELDAAIEEFRQRVLTLPRAELPGLEATARTISKLQPSAGAALLVEFWEHDKSPDRVTKILAVMDPDRADEILACLDAARARELLSRRMQLVRPETTRGARRR